MNDLKFDAWIIQSTVEINFMSSKDSDDEGVLHSKSDNIKITISGKADEFVEEIFQSSFSRYHQIGLETIVKDSYFVFDCVHSFCCKCHKVYQNHGGSYLDFPDSIKNKKAIINPVNDENKCFQYAVTVALNHEKIRKHPERI